MEIHRSSVVVHGNLRSSTCLVDNRWVCKLSNFGMDPLKTKHYEHTAHNNVGNEMLEKGEFEGRNIRIGLFTKVTELWNSFPFYKKASFKTDSGNPLEAQGIKILIWSMYSHPNRLSRFMLDSVKKKF